MNSSIEIFSRRFDFQIFEDRLIDRGTSAVYNSVLSRNFVIGFLVNFFAAKNKHDLPYQNIVDTFISYRSNTNFLIYGIVEKFSSTKNIDFLLHIICLANFESELTKIPLPDIPVSQLSIETFIQNVKNQYPLVKTIDNHLYMLDMAQRCEYHPSIYRLPSPTSIWEYGFWEREFFARIGIKSGENLDFNTFQNAEHTPIDGREFGRDFFNMAAKEWQMLVGELKLDFGIDGFCEYIIGGLSNWIGFTVDNVMVDRRTNSVENNDQELEDIRNIYYVVDDAFEVDTVIRKIQYLH